ncbi:MAG: sulfite exporter TauE/SafE family protein, partial [Burkholderiales bacterium]
MDWLYTISGFAVGFIVGLTGVGGGSLMTPLLVLGFGIVPATAVGTDLLYAAITKMGGVWVHGRRSNVDWKIVGLLASGSLPASLVTVWALKKYAVETASFNSLITTTLGIA